MGKSLKTASGGFADVAPMARATAKKRGNDEAPPKKRMMELYDIALHCEETDETSTLIEGSPAAPIRLLTEAMSRADAFLKSQGYKGAWLEVVATPRQVEVDNPAYTRWLSSRNGS